MSDINQSEYEKAMELKKALDDGVITPGEMASGKSLAEILESREAGDGS